MFSVSTDEDASLLIAGDSTQLQLDEFSGVEQDTVTRVCVKVHSDKLVLLSSISVSANLCRQLIAVVPPTVWFGQNEPNLAP
jgi:hypothetical protein